MKKNNKMREKIGDWLMDISKYLLTAIFLTSVFSDVQGRPVGGWLSVSIAFVILFAGLYFIKPVKNKK